MEEEGGTGLVLNGAPWWLLRGGQAGGGGRGRELGTREEVILLAQPCEQGAVGQVQAEKQGVLGSSRPRDTS